MSPMINEMVVQDRIREARQRAERHRVRRVARVGALQRTSLQALRGSLGHGLIAIGERLAGQPPMPDSSAVRRAA